MFMPNQAISFKHTQHPLQLLPPLNVFPAHTYRHCSVIQIFDYVR